jgi:hypothetical protein
MIEVDPVWTVIILAVVGGFCYFLGRHSGRQEGWTARGRFEQDGTKPPWA